MANHSISINENLYNDIRQYCELNGLKINVFCCDLLKKGLNTIKYGDIPFGVVEQLKGNAVPVQYVEPIELHIEPFATELIPVTPISKTEVFPNEIPTENIEEAKKKPETRKKRTRELK